MKKCYCFLLIIAMIFTSINIEMVHADTIDTPDTTVYQSDVSALPKYSKLYFGGYTGTDKRWVVAGKEATTNTLVVLSDPEDAKLTSAVGGRRYYGITRFNESRSDNDYDGSTLDAVIRGLYGDGSYSSKKAFTNAEIELMKAVPLDSIAAGKERKMYAASGSEGSVAIAIGSGRGTQNLIIGSSGLNNSVSFWLSSPHRTTPTNALYVYGTSIDNRSVNTYFEVVPAFNLKLDSTLFSSTAMPACADAAFDGNNIMIVRYDSAKDADGNSCTDRISSKAKIYADKLVINNPTNEEYLYVVWKEGSTNKVKSFALSAGKTTYSSSDIGISEINSSTKVWIEKRVAADNLVYAKVASTPGITPSASNFDYIPPTGSPITYDGTQKEATVISNQEGMGSISIYYLDENNNKLTTPPTNAGTYKVCIDVEEGESYEAANEIEIGSFEIKKATLAAPEGLSTVNTSGPGESDGAITGLNSAYNYQYKVGDGEWIDQSAGSVSINALSAQTYSVRIAESQNYEATEAVTYTIEDSSNTPGGEDPDNGGDSGDNNSGNGNNHNGDAVPTIDGPMYATKLKIDAADIFKKGGINLPSGVKFRLYAADSTAIKTMSKIAKVSKKGIISPKSTGYACIEAYEEVKENKKKVVKPIGRANIGVIAPQFKADISATNAGQIFNAVELLEDIKPDDSTIFKGADIIKAYKAAGYTVAWKGPKSDKVAKLDATTGKITITEKSGNYKYQLVVTDPTTKRSVKYSGKIKVTLPKEDKKKAK